MATVTDILGPGGALAQQLPGYEARAQQVTMAELIAEAIAGRQHAIIEAPTGVGKSLGYLIPIAQHVVAANEKAVVSTCTIALQEQLIGKDLPLVGTLVPGLVPVLVKGRQNYLCLRRLALADPHHDGQLVLFETREEARELAEIATWARTTSTGDRQDLPFAPAPAVWRQIQSDRHLCLGRNCTQFADCFFRRARRRIEDANLLVVNHHLYCADMALTDDSAAILPGHAIAVFDEAHTLEDIATEHLGTSVGDAQVRYFLDSLHNERTGKGLLAEERFAAALPLIAAARTANQELWRTVATCAQLSGDTLLRLSRTVELPDELPGALQVLMRHLADLRGLADDDSLAQELRAQAERAAELAHDLRHLIDRDREHYVYYAEVPAGRGSPSLRCNPLAVGDLLKEALFERIPTVILTSATMAADDSDRFLFLRRRLGIEGGLARRLDSPFDYATQARLLVNRSPLDPNSSRYEQALAQWLGDFLDQAEGGTFILFTSYRQLNAVHDLVRPRLDRADRFVLRQGDRLERRQMLELFKQVGNGILFGTASFWEGVDVQGSALSNVIITKLPFEMPTHPLIEARLQEIKAGGGNPFMERSVPEAILRLKQGVGRLIRTRADRGTVVICDHRVTTARYGRYFIRALPPMPTTYFELMGG